LTSAANVDIEPIWATLLAKALEGKNVKELLSNVGSGGGAPAAGSAAPATSSGPAAAEAPKEEAKEEKEEESDDDMVRVLSDFQFLQVSLMLFLRRIGLRTFRLIYLTTYILGELVSVACPMWGF